MKKSEFLKTVNEGIKRNKDFMVVKIDTEGNPSPEIIINGVMNFKAKISYYKKAYDDNMELIQAKKNGKLVRIVDVLFTNNFNDLSWFVY